MQKLNIIKEVILRQYEISLMTMGLEQQIVDYYLKEYGRDAKIIALVVGKGAINFARDISAKSSLKSDPNFTLHEIIANSYHGGVESSGTVDVDLKGAEVTGKHVLVIDDILDTGATVHAVIEEIKNQSPASISLCVMIKRKRDDMLHPEIVSQFVGHETETSDFLIGAGFDYQGKFRDLPYIATLDMDKVRELEKKDLEIKKECFCNKCGGTCGVKEDRGGRYGLIDAIAKGGYYSLILEDCTAYRFDMCEECLKKLFDSFKLPPDEVEYHVWTGELMEW